MRDSHPKFQTRCRKFKTNYGQFNIRFVGPKTWNNINENLKSISFPKFKKSIVQEISDKYKFSTM